jgi:hypothetical protein
LQVAFAAGPLQGLGQQKISMISMKNKVNGVPIGASGPAEIAAFNEG